MGRLLEALGVARERITLESRSRDTYENAVFTKRLVNPGPGERWLLITTAWHMPRAMGCFRQAGFAVQPWPVDYRTSGRIELWLNPGIPEGLRQMDFIVREYAGLAMYYSEGPHRRLAAGPVTSRTDRHAHRRMVAALLSAPLLAAGAMVQLHRRTARFSSLLSIVGSDGAVGVAEAPLKPTWSGVSPRSIAAVLEDLLLPASAGYRCCRGTRRSARRSRAFPRIFWRRCWSTTPAGRCGRRRAASRFGAC